MKAFVKLKTADYLSDRKIECHINSFGASTENNRIILTEPNVHII